MNKFEHVQVGKKGGHCTVLSKLNKFENVRGGRCPCMMRCNVSWAIVPWDPHPLNRQADRQDWLYLCHSVGGWWKFVDAIVWNEVLISTWVINLNSFNRSKWIWIPSCFEQCSLSWYLSTGIWIFRWQTTLHNHTNGKWRTPLLVFRK